MEKKTNRPVVPEELMAVVAQSMMGDYHRVREGADSPVLQDSRLDSPVFKALAHTLCEAYALAANGLLDPEVIQGKLARLIAKKSPASPESDEAGPSPTPQPAPTVEAVTRGKPDMEGSWVELD